MQLSSPSEKTQRAIQDLWAQLMGSKALIASDIMGLSSDNVLLQLREVDTTLKEGESTPTSAGLRSSRSSVSAAASKQNARLGARLTPKCNIASVSKAAGRISGNRPSSAASSGNSNGAAAQLPAGTTDSWGSADAFAKCLKEICCQGASEEKKGSLADLGTSELEKTLKAIQTGVDSEDDLMPSDTKISQQLLSSQAQPVTETEGREMPKDWVNLLKLMAQEATALFRKHKTLVDKEVCYTQALIRLLEP